MAIDLGSAMVKGLYNKSKGQRVTAPLPPADNMPWGPVPNANPAYIDPRVAPNAAGFPPPRGPSLPPQGAMPHGAAPMNAPMPPMAEPPILGPAQPTMQTRTMKRRATIAPGRKAPGSQQPSAASVTAEPAGNQLVRMMARGRGGA
jgi:hypothetical protein